jgi:CRP-like cAMP-binding protein
MARTNQNTEVGPQVNVLRYRKGEQIIKQGDYGISIYIILRGKVEIFRESKEKEIPLAVLGPGDTIGEMTFLNRKVEVRSASARAIEASELEVWHPSLLAKKYEEVPPVLKVMIDQALDRLTKMNKLLDRLNLNLLEAQETAEPKLPRSESRGFYRKALEVECFYAPAKPANGFQGSLSGRIMNISMTGLRMEIPSRNLTFAPHGIGDSFQIDMVLPNQQPLKATGKVVSVNKQNGRILLGMSFLDLPEHYRKTLWFFMLPT